MARIISIDPGEKNIGVAITDPTKTIASPFMVFRHRSRKEDARTIIDIAEEQDADTIIIGYSLDESGKPTYQGRKSVRLASEIRNKTAINVELWDEGLSTHDAIDAVHALGTPMMKRGGHHDDIAAAIILQSYLEANKS